MATVIGRTSIERSRLAEFLQDPGWAGKPVWMVNILQFKGGHGNDGEASYHEYLRQQEAQEGDRRIVMKGYARTIIGVHEHQMLTIVEYPSPAVFAAMGKSDAYAKRNQQLRLAGLERQFLIPIKPGFWKLDSPAAQLSRPLRTFSPESVWTTPSGLVGGAAENSRVGVTSGTQPQSAAFVADATIGSTNIVWHLNLLRFSDRGVGETPGTVYSNYAKAMGRRNGVLAQYGARSTLAADCFPSLIGDQSFDRAIIAEYPCREVRPR
eukprot:COSAG05_NODE_853_length_6963_cov_5.582314_6_plen_266_part_00